MTSTAGVAPIVQAVGVGVTFDGVHALEGVDLVVGPAEVVGLIGPNGAGKTTLLNVLSGFQRPTSGQVLIDGTDATRWGPERTVARGVARTFQAVRPFPALTVAQNVELGALGVGRSKRRSAELVDHILDALALYPYRNRPASDLPHGEERRLGIARALATGPRILLLDEPAAGANDAESDELVSSLRSVATGFDCSLLIIEHDMRLIMTLCERIHVLDYGRTIAEGTPGQIQRDPAVRAAYLGMPTGAA